MPDPREIELDTLRSLLSQENAPHLLDVLTADAHAAWRIPGSRNACIYEVSFPQQVESLAVDPAHPIVVYDSGPSFHAAEDACHSLAELGFQDVQWFRGGREAWSNAGLAAEGSEASQPWTGGTAPLAPAGQFLLDTEKSRIFWHGRNAANGHHGQIRFAEGSIDVENGLPVAGTAVADMHSITCDDLEGDMAQGLLRHLATGDFFQTDRHPTATFVVDTARFLEGASPGKRNVDVEGQLTIRAKAHPVRFEAVFAATADGVALQGGFELDRTRWGSRYGSGSLYDRLGMHLVNDEISVQVRLVAARESQP